MCRPGLRPLRASARDLVDAQHRHRRWFGLGERDGKTGEVTVTEGGWPVTQLNELECVGAAVYANVLPTDRIVRIDPATGVVTATIDASGLWRAAEAVPGSTLNGIAAVPGTNQFLVTGKFWPRVVCVAVSA
ncbi:glutaminyl-peptide cyclotransferase [Streptomyces sp. NPDC005096]|uniref:glutaminyl-peptide cyclotransferase n=1 Tax=Streptomyces sp. NPDC005096 TaxID=3154559 RepID=UPI0033B0FF39